MNFINVKLTTFMCVSGKSRGRLTATVEATTSNNEQSVNKETADIFLLFYFFAQTVGLQLLGTKSSRNVVTQDLFKAEMISRGYTFLLCQLVTCLWRPSTNKKSSLPRIKILIRLWSKIGIQEIILEKRMRCNNYDYAWSSACKKLPWKNWSAANNMRKACLQNGSQSQSLLR